MVQPRVYKGAGGKKQNIGIRIAAGDGNRVLDNDVTEAGTTIIDVAVASSNTQERDNQGHTNSFAVLHVATAASATTPGSCVKKVEIYSADGGTFLGYLAVYSSIA